MPALVVINDGRFPPEDAKGVLQLGASNKVSDHGAIGRFGLGQKAAFHICEAFFYASRDNDYASSPLPQFDVVNPWEEIEEHSRLHPGWSEKAEDDQAMVRDLIEALIQSPDTALQSERYVAFWLPLRSEIFVAANGKQLRPIVYEYHTPDDIAQDLNPAGRLATLLPLLKKIRNIECFQQIDRGDTDHFEPIAMVRLSKGSAQIPRRTDEQQEGR